LYTEILDALKIDDFTIIDDIIEKIAYKTKNLSNDERIIFSDIKKLKRLRKEIF
jgi:hypothetical protein